MSLEIQVVSQEKAKWAEGLLVLIDSDKKWLGGESFLNEIPELEGPQQQLKANSTMEASAYIGKGAKSRIGLFLSTRQVKYYSAEDKLRVLGSRAVSYATKVRMTKLLIPAEHTDESDLTSLLQGILTADYSFKKYKSSIPGETSPDLKVTVSVSKEQLKQAQTTVKHMETVFGGVTLARDLVNEIPTELYPEQMAEIAKKAGTESGLKVTIYDEKRLAKEHFNGVLSVGKGSHRPPRLTIMSYEPANKSNIHLCLVGKAVTFDTGGHSLKPAKSMWEMKGDMAGGAAVVGAMKAIGNLKPKIKVTGIIPSAVNAIGPNAMLPGDIIRSRSGKTVHVDNTDAEGRLLLMDGLNLAQELGATHIVDVATLTGSIVRALGEAMCGLFANDDSLADAIKESGSEVGEDFWRMPLIEEYREQLDHPVADIDNVGKGGNAGSIVAALFLKEFVTDDVKWAHLDIAACGLYTKNYKYCALGASGFGVRTLVQLAANLGKTQ